MRGELSQGFGDYENPLFGALNQEYGDTDTSEHSTDNPEDGLQPCAGEEITIDRPTTRHAHRYEFEVRGHGAAEHTIVDYDTGEIYYDL